MLSLSFRLFLLSLLCDINITLAMRKIVPKPRADENLFSVSIIHVNDFHARFEETSWTSGNCPPEPEPEGDPCIGGYARMVTVVKQLLEDRKDHNPVYLNAGDSFQGTLWYNVHRWNVTSHFLNKLPADAMTIGNHEFDDKIEGLVPFLQNIDSPIVAANIDHSEEPTMAGLYQNSIVIDRYERKIGVIGVVLSSYPTMASTEKLRFLDEITTVRAEAEHLSLLGVDIIIVLSHCGLDVDREIAKHAGPDIDVIVGGHSHTFLWTGETPPGPDRPWDEYPVVVEQESLHKVLIVQAAAFAKYVGNLTVYFDEEGELHDWEGAPVFLSADVDMDPEIVEELKPWKEEVDKFGVKVVGETRVELLKTPCNNGECSLGNLITDSYANAFVGKDPDNGWTFAAIAFINNGGIRAPIDKGTIHFNDLVATTPFENTIDTMELRGDKILAVLEHVGAGQMLHFSGLKVVYNMTNPVGDRVISVQVRCQKCEIPKFEPLEIFTYYRVALPSFLVEGGSFIWFNENGRKHKVGPRDIDVLEAYVERQSPIMSRLDGRLVMFE